MRATGEEDGVPFPNNWVYSVRPIVLLILSGRGTSDEFFFFAEQKSPSARRAALEAHAHRRVQTRLLTALT